MYKKIKVYKIPALFCFITASLMIMMLMWDLYVGIEAPYFIQVKVFCISCIMGIGLVTMYKKKFLPDLSQFYAIILFGYAWYCQVYLHWSYYFAFLQIFAVMSFFSMGRLGFYFVSSTLGLALAFHASTITHFPLENGIAITSHYYFATFIFYVIGIATHLLVFRFKAQIEKLDEQFSMLGKKSAFLSHEMRTPLNRILSRANNGEDIPADFLSDVQRIASILSSIEALSRNNQEIQKTFHPFEWDKIREELLEDHEEYLKEMNIEFKIEGFEGEYKGNKPLFYRLFKSLIINAVESIGYNPHSSLIHISLERTKKGLLIDVTNTNSQIPKQYLPQIFEAYFSSKKMNSNNQGLGLFMVKNIVESHKGEISVFSEENRTSFKIKLPVS